MKMQSIIYSVLFDRGLDKVSPNQLFFFGGTLSWITVSCCFATLSAAAFWDMVLGSTYHVSAIRGTTLIVIAMHQKG